MFIFIFIALLAGWPILLGIFCGVIQLFIDTIQELFPPPPPPPPKVSFFSKIPKEEFLKFANVKLPARKIIYVEDPPGVICLGRTREQEMRLRAMNPEHARRIQEAAKLTHGGLVKIVVA